MVEMKNGGPGHAFIVKASELDRTDQGYKIANALDLSETEIAMEWTR
jgi:hypothetical protein